MKHVLLFAAAFLLLETLSAQNTFPSSGSAGIGTTTPNASSLLDMQSTTQGVLVPRMTENQRTLIASPATGLLVYQTNNASGFYYNAGGDSWIRLVTLFDAANTSLSNLTSTLINTSLNASSDNSLDLGSSTKQWRDGYLGGSLFLDGTKFISNAGGNTLVGSAAGSSITTGGANSFYGSSAGGSTTTGILNSFFGSGAGSSNISGSQNCFFGINAGNINTASDNCFFGPFSGDVNTTGSENCFFGNSSGGSNISGNGCVMIGALAGNNSTSGNNNTFVGSSNGTGNTTGASNTFIGYQAGSINTTGSNNTCIGLNANVASGALTNTTAVGNGANVNTSNTFVFGNASVTKYGFGKNCASANILDFQVTTAKLTTGGAWTNASDRRLKENFKSLDKNEVLKKINHLDVTQWNYIAEKNATHIGPMAQDFYAAFKTGDDTTISTIDPAGVALIGIQALTAKNDQLALSNDQLISKVQVLESEITALKTEMEALLSSTGKEENALNDGAVKLQSSGAVSQPILGQNVPNPFDHSTIIPFRIPKGCSSASIVVSETSTGRIITAIPVSCDETHAVIDAGSLASGNYTYALIVDGTVIDTRQLTLSR